MSGAAALVGVATKTQGAASGPAPPFDEAPPSPPLPSGATGAMASYVRCTEHSAKMTEISGPLGLRK